MANRIRKKSRGSSSTQPAAPEPRINEENEGPDNPEIRVDHENRFTSPLALDRFNNVLRKKSIIVEREINRDKVSVEVLGLLDSKGWRSLTHIPEDLPNFSIVREFYANLSVVGPAVNTVFIRGRPISIAPAAINEYYRIHSVPDLLDYQNEIERLTDEEVDVAEMCRLVVAPNVQWNTNAKGERQDLTTSQFTSDNKVLVKFILNRIHPLSQQVRLKIPELYILHALLNNVPINVGTRINLWIKGLRGTTKKSLPFPHLITQLAKQAAVPEFPDDIKPPKHSFPITADSSLARLGVRPPQPPPAPRVTSFEQNMYSVAGSVRDWAEQDRLSLVGVSRGLNLIAERLGVDFSEGIPVSHTPRQYESFLDPFIPPRGVEAQAPDEEQVDDDDME